MSSHQPGIQSPPSCPALCWAARLGEHSAFQRDGRDKPAMAACSGLKSPRTAGLSFTWPLSGGSQSSGSSLRMEAPWLEPTQNVTGVVVLSTNTRRMLVVLGS